MTLPDGPRQIAAGLAASAGFLALFFGADLVWWLALLLGVLVYGAVLLLVRRRPSAAEVFVTEGVSRSDLEGVLADLSSAALRLSRAAEAAPPADAPLIAEMAERVAAIRDHHRTDPRDVTYTRRFIRTDLPLIVETTEGYVDLSRRARGGSEARLGPLAERLRGFLPVMERIEQACLDNDFRELEVQLAVLSGKLDRRYGAVN